MILKEKKAFVEKKNYLNTWIIYGDDILEYCSDVILKYFGDEIVE